MMESAAKQILTRPMAELAPYARNARLHSAEQVERIARSIAEFGFVAPVLIDREGAIVAGHGRVLAAQRLGLAAVPTICADWLTPEQVRAYRLADNQLALLAEWDEALLGQELAELRDLSVDLSLLGFDAGALDALLGAVGAGGSSGGAPPPRSPHEARGKLAERFMLPPFSVLNAREGWWQQRKAAWIALGIKSELGRGAGLTIEDVEHLGAEQMNDYRNRAADPSPGGSPRSAADYSKRQRGNGAGGPL